MAIGRGGSVVMAVLVAAILFPGVVRADELAKSGTGTIHSGWRGAGSVTEVGDKHVYWTGTWSAVSFNDEGRGFLHRMAWTCPAVSDINNGVASMRGMCVLTDAQGDKIHGNWSNEGPLDKEVVGRFEMTAGTGKYAGIKGGWDIACTVITVDAASCRQKYTYRLP